MLEDAEQKKQEIEKEREELTLGGSLFLYQVKWKRVVLFVSDRISGSDQPAFFPYTSVFVLLRVQKKPSFRCITHYCTLVGDSCRDGGRDWAKRIKDYDRYINVKHGTIWHILTHSEEAPHSDAGKCRAGEKYLGKGKARFDPCWQEFVPFFSHCR